MCSVSVIQLAVNTANILLMCHTELYLYFTVMYTTAVPFECDLYELEYFDRSFIVISTY